MTLCEASERLNLTPQRIAEILELGGEVSPAEQLGRMARRTGLALSTVRDRLVKEAAVAQSSHED
jgi:hypothetical protein